MLNNIMQVSCFVFIVLIIGWLFFEVKEKITVEILKIKDKIKYIGKKGNKLKKFEMFEWAGLMYLQIYRYSEVSNDKERANMAADKLIEYAEKIKETGHEKESFVVDYVSENFK